MLIDRRFNGPPDSGNGGVSCGLLAAHVDAPAVEVTLRRPPPLEVEMRVESGQLYDGDVLIATAVSATVDLEPPVPLSVEQAAAAERRFAGFVQHPYPGCFVCGTDRPPPDGLGLRPGRVAPNTVAARWTPESDDPFFVWAALDCPGGWSSDIPGRPMVLGRMTLQQLAAPTAGVPHVVMGWLLGVDGRKTFTGSVLYDAEGLLHAIAQQTWIAVPD